MSKPRPRPVTDAIILAAGRGSRISSLTAGRPKCLLPVRRTTLLGRQVATLRACGVRRITVVVGYMADAIRSECAPESDFIENDLFDSTNSLYSLWLARERLANGALVLNADVLFHARMLRHLLASPHEDAVLVSFRAPHDPPMTEEEMKVSVKHARVTVMSKSLPPSAADGENVGIAKFGAAGASVLAECLDRLVSEGATRDWAPRAYAAFARDRALHAIGTRGLPWIEIDSPDDYFRALTEVVPRLDWGTGAGAYASAGAHGRTGTAG